MTTKKLRPLLKLINRAKRNLKKVEQLQNVYTRKWKNNVLSWDFEQETLINDLLLTYEYLANPKKNSNKSYIEAKKIMNKYIRKPSLLIAVYKINKKQLK